MPISLSLSKETTYHAIVQVEDEDNADYILQYVASFGDQMPNQGELQDSRGKNLGGFYIFIIYTIYDIHMIICP